MAAWKLPLIVAAIVAPIVAGFLIGGPGVGVAVGALAVLALLVVAARQRPRGPIRPAGTSDRRRHVLLVATCAVEDPEAVREIAAAGGLDGGDGAEEESDVLVLAPAKIGFLDRWASDVEPARHRAQQSLVATVAALAKAGIAAEARVGDEDVVQAVEDQLQSFPATDVVLVVDGAEEPAAAEAASAELESRLQARFRRVVVGAD
jgi:hypothetical protein